MGNIKHRERSIDIFNGGAKTEEFTRLNPRQMVPVITEGDFTLCESNAIIKYLCETRESLPKSLWPDDPV